MQGKNRACVAILNSMELRFKSCKDAAKYLSGQTSHISECLDGIRLTHKGYTFREVNENGSTF